MMASAVYDLFARAMQERKQILCLYQGLPREICPIILGHTKGAEVALVFQFGGRPAKVCRPQANGNASIWRRSPMCGFAMAHGMRGRGTICGKAAWRWLTSTSTPRTHTARRPAFIAVASVAVAMPLKKCPFGQPSAC
jgi:hypothetical protein